MPHPMIEAAICPMCGQKWCGRPCLCDPEKSNALLFKKDGSEKTLHERGLAWDDPPLKPKPTSPRSKPRLVEPILKELAKRGVRAGAVTEKKPEGVTEKAEAVPIKRDAAPIKRDAVTNNPVPVTKKGRGRPKGGMTAAERAAAYRKRKAKRLDFKG